VTAAPAARTETTVALDVARDLARVGIPIFLAEPALGDDGRWLPTGGHGESGYWLPREWEKTTPDPSVVDRWRPGMALCMVTGHGLDGVDVDPRHGGDKTAAEMKAAGCWPRPVGQQETPSGGWHDVVNALGVRSKDNAAQGVDVKAGDADGEGRGFLFLAPTVKLSKDGEIRSYRWTIPPNLDELDPADDTGDVLAERISASRAARHDDDAPDLPRAYDALNDAQQAAVLSWLAGTVRLTGKELADIAGWPEGYRDDRGRGWQKVLADACNRFGRLARAGWTPWTRTDAHQELAAIVPPTIAKAVGFQKTWWAQWDRRSPAPWPETLDATCRLYAGTMPAGGVAGTVYTATENILDEPGDAAGERHRGQARIAYRLARLYAERLMYVHGIGWHVWDKRRWVEDDRGAATRAVLNVLKMALADSIVDMDLRHDVRKCETAAGVRGVLDLAAALTPFAHTVADLDADPYVINVANGTLDLHTMTLRRHNPMDRITKVTRAAYDPAAAGPEWDKFLTRILPDEDVRSFLQRYAGLALCGRVIEHLFTIATGTGANGKGTTYNALLYALGDYGHVAESDLFMVAKSNPNGATPALMGLRGRRLVVVSETERDHRLATALMKNLTGGDPITARPLYGKPVTFQPSHTSLMVTNFLPRVEGNDEAAWRRIRVIPFKVVIPEDQRDGNLGEHLELEADAVLAWAVDGYRQYETRGMDAPDAVQTATGDYLKASDAIARFIDDCCIVNPLMHTPPTQLHERWVRWATEDGAEPMSLKTFGKALDLHGFPVVGGTTRDRRNRRGIGLAHDENEDENGVQTWL
jgi:putative DNA primase/helicase